MELAVLFKLLFKLVGGLGIFLLGMKYMSDGMQAVAGSRLRGMISLATNNRLLATGVGVVVTCIVQSSSITTVMVVGFVNSGVMQLAQALGGDYGRQHRHYHYRLDSGVEDWQVWLATFGGSSDRLPFFQR